MSQVSLLGPQRRRPSAPAMVRRIGGRVAVITAGWQERENDPLPGGLEEESTNLGIYAKAERVFDEDRELFRAHRERQRSLRRLQRLYRMRLDHAIDAHRELAEMTDLAGESEVLAGERRAALEALRALDRHHLEQVSSIHARFEAEWQPGRRPAVARRRAELESELESAASVVIAGGHVAVLINRLRLFDLAPLLEGKSIVAWSAGAMILGRRIVLFHDSPPWGAGNAEVLDAGLGLCGSILPLPDVGRRLRVDDPRRVGQLACRFAPLACVGLDETSRLRREAGGWRARGAKLFGLEGDVRLVGRSRWESLQEESAS